MNKVGTISNLRMKGIGVKSKPSIQEDKSLEIYEVNEDFARIALSILGISYITINQKELEISSLSKFEETKKASIRKESIPIQEGLSLEAILFDFLLNL